MLYAGTQDNPIEALHKYEIIGCRVSKFVIMLIEV